MAAGEAGRRLAVREVGEHSVDRHERQVDRAEAHRGAPPPAVEERVAAVDQGRLVVRDDPGDLRVARPVGGRDGRDPKRPDLHRLPGLDDAGVELSQAALGELEGGVFQPVPAGRSGAQDGRAPLERRLQRGRVGVVCVQMRDEGKVGEAGGTGQSRSRLADEARNPFGVLEQVHDGEVIPGLELEPGPSKATYAHGDFLLLTTVRERSFVR
jgi:hypothetical protein